MSTRARDTVNSIPNIRSKSYLELGTWFGETFLAVRAAIKVGVDAGPPAGAKARPTHLMTTDEYFEGPGKNDKFDVIFIDACHEYAQVVKDYNNAASRLNPGGLILIHDLVPPDEVHTESRLCGDGFKLLRCLLDMETSVCVLDHDYGLTAIRNPVPVAPPVSYATLTFEQRGKVSVSSFSQMVAFVQG